MDGSGNRPTKFNSKNLKEGIKKNLRMYLHTDVQNGLGSLKI